MESPALDLLHDLPLELLQHILLLLVPPSLPPFELQGLRWRYSTVCKRWAQILAHPHQIVLSSLPQIERLALLLAASSERTGEVREILVTPERFMGNVGHDAVAGLVDLCGGLERFGLWRPSKGSNATLLAEHSLLWDALIRRRGLVEFDCRATIHGVRLFQYVSLPLERRRVVLTAMQSSEWMVESQKALPRVGHSPPIPPARPTSPTAPPPYAPTAPQSGHLPRLFVLPRFRQRVGGTLDLERERGAVRRVVFPPSVDGTAPSAELSRYVSALRVHRRRPPGSDRAASSLSRATSIRKRVLPREHDRAEELEVAVGGEGGRTDAGRAGEGDGRDGESVPEDRVPQETAAGGLSGGGGEARRICRGGEAGYTS